MIHSVIAVAGGGSLRKYFLISGGFMKIENKIHLLFLTTIFYALIMSACASPVYKSVGIIVDTPTISASPTHKILVQTTQSENPAIQYTLCSQAPVGSRVTCMIPTAFCSYKPGVKGKPTFCNDARYPNHNFTLVVWDQNWSELNGNCLLVQGVIKIYNGKPEIEAVNKSEISSCEYEEALTD